MSRGNVSTALMICRSILAGDREVVVVVVEKRKGGRRFMRGLSGRLLGAAKRNSPGETFPGHATKPLLNIHKHNPKTNQLQFHVQRARHGVDHETGPMAGFGRVDALLEHVSVPRHVGVAITRTSASIDEYRRLYEE